MIGCWPSRVVGHASLRAVVLSVLPVLLISCGSTGDTSGGSGTVVQVSAASDSPAAAHDVPVAADAAGIPRTTFQHVFVIVLENQSMATVSQVPYFQQLAMRGVQLTNYTGVAHPSQPNYLALLAGATFTSSDQAIDIPNPNLVDLLTKQHLTWRAYEETYPGGCFQGDSQGDFVTGTYARSHNPFISFNDIRSDAKRCANIVSTDQLSHDVANNTVPSFAMIVPNKNHDGHDRSIGEAAQWLQANIEPEIAQPALKTHTLFVVVFDEDDDQADTPSAHPIYAVLFGDGVRAQAVDSLAYTHYSVLRTVEQNFGLPTLAAGDAAAHAFAACDLTSSEAACK